MGAGRPRLDPDDACERASLTLPSSYLRRFKQRVEEGNIREPTFSAYIRRLMDEDFEQEVPALREIAKEQTRAKLAKLEAYDEIAMEAQQKRSIVRNTAVDLYTRLRMKGVNHLYKRSVDEDWLDGRYRSGDEVLRKAFPGMNKAQMYDVLQDEIAMRAEREKRM